MVEMELVGVRLEMPANTPIVLLQESEGLRRILPIYIGTPEAAAIAYALEKVPTPRPLTHDLMKNVLDTLEVRLERIVVTELKDHTFYAELYLRRDGEVQRVSSRPSDAIALAVRTNTPIFAEEGVLDEVGQTPDESGEPEEAEQAQELVEEFQRFIDTVSPEDFGTPEG